MTTEMDNGVGFAIGLSLGGFAILLAAIIVAATCYCKERSRRVQHSNGSLPSTASILSGHRCGPGLFRFPIFSKPSRPTEDGGFPDTMCSTAQLVRPGEFTVTGGNGRVFTIPASSDNSSNRSSFDSHSENLHKSKPTNHNSINFYYQCDAITSDNNDNKKQKCNDSNKVSPLSETNNTVSASINAGNLQKPRDITRISQQDATKSTESTRRTQVPEDFWNSTVDQLFNSALSLHEYDSIIGGRNSVFPV